MNGFGDAYVESRLPEDCDDTPIVITRGFFRQAIRDAVAYRKGKRYHVEFPFIPENSHIIGIIFYGSKVSISLANGDLLECDFWPDEIG